MKTMKKLAGLLLVLVMALAVAAPAMAEDIPDTGKCEITIEMPYGIDMTVKNTYSIYKVFDAFKTEAGHIRYKPLDPSYTNFPEDSGFYIIRSVDGDYVGFGRGNYDDSSPEHGDGSMQEVSISGLGQYVADLEKEHGVGPAYVVTVTEEEWVVVDAQGQTLARGTIPKEEDAGDDVQDGEVAGGDDGASFTGEDSFDETGAKITFEVDPGYYYISTTTGSAVYVNSFIKEATVTDKNFVPTMTKEISGAAKSELAIVGAGETVAFEIKIKAGKGARDYVLHDEMEAGLRFNDGSVKVEFSRGEAKEAVDASNYTVTVVTAPSDNHTFLDIAFDNDWLKKLQQDDEITVTYTATVDGNLEGGGKNTAHLSYGDHNTAPDDVTVYNAKVTVYKVDGASPGQPLAGAGFVLRNDTEGDENYGKYYRLANGAISWVNTIGGANGATEYTTRVGDGKAEIAFTGLPAGTYTLIENTVPNGYNKAADVAFKIYDVDETIIEDDPEKPERNWEMKDLQVEHTVVNQAGRELPSTGGIGTTVFTIAGGALMLGAAVLFITKKRSSGD